MNKILVFSICTILLSACAPFKEQAPINVGTDKTEMNMPNPASTFCEQNGNRLEIRAAADGSQSGICIFPDGSFCDEWAYFRGECAPAMTATPEQIATAAATTDASGGYMPSGTSEEITDWRGVIKRSQAGAQYDDFFELWTNGQIIYFGIDSTNPTIQAQIATLRDSGKIVHLYGTLFSNVPDYNGSRILVDRIEIE